MIKRRQFIQNVVGSAIALAAARMCGAALETPEHISPSANPGKLSNRLVLRGVNLGGWLVLEKWMVPSVYRGSDALDEYSLCLALGGKAGARLNRHRETFITAGDFRWIKNCGLNAVRLPVGYWAIEPPKPYVGACDYIEFALEQAQKNDLKLILDLHGAPGSQNGWDHSGRAGAIDWHKDPNNIKETVRVLGSFAQKFGNHPALFGVELLNEPSDHIPVEVLRDFYRNAYAEVRKYSGPGVAIIFHDSFRAMAWQNFMNEPDYENVVIDTHLYQLFNQDDNDRTASQQIIFALNRKSSLEQMQRVELPTLVGEWSLALPYRATKDLSSFQSDLVNSAYADTQLLCFENTRGWFFWSYKLESDSEWNFRYCVERGWLPEHFPA